MLSPSAKISLMAQETTEREICLLTITHPDFDRTLYLSTDPTEYLFDEETTGTPVYGTKSRGRDYVYLPMSPTLPSSDSETPPTGTFPSATCPARLPHICWSSMTNTRRSRWRWSWLPIPIR